MKTRNVMLHIIYGVPCIGKSTAAIGFACHQQIRTVIHTDYVREVQRGFVPPEASPALAKVTHSAWELYGQPTPHNIVAGFVDHVAEIAVGIRLVVRKLVADGFDAVVEGAHFHSAVIEDLRIANAEANIQATLLVVETGDETMAADQQQGRKSSLRSGTETLA